MRAYHNDPEIKSKILTQLQAHYDADEIIKGTYWENGKGCAIGCTLHSSNHRDYEKLFGIPKQLAVLEEYIFERLPNDLAKKFPIEFISSISIGADLSLVWPKLFLCLLNDDDFGIRKYVDCDTIMDSLDRITDLFSAYIQDKRIDIDEWDSVRLCLYDRLQNNTDFLSTITRLLYLSACPEQFKRIMPICSITHSVFECHEFYCDEMRILEGKLPFDPNDFFIFLKDKLLKILKETT